MLKCSLESATLTQPDLGRHLVEETCSEQPGGYEKHSMDERAERVAELRRSLPCGLSCWCPGSRGGSEAGSV